MKLPGRSISSLLDFRIDSSFSSLSPGSRNIRRADRRHLRPIAPDTIASVLSRITESVLAASSYSDATVADNYDRKEKRGTEMKYSIQQ